MKTIPLTQDKFAIVDDEDFDRLNEYKWYAGKRKNGNYYAQRSIKVNDTYRSILMHSEIMKTDKKVDWKNGNTLDNRKENLFITTVSEISRKAHTGLKYKKHEKITTITDAAY